jgi:energy-converting hydrogenase Eha subunit B
MDGTSFGLGVYVHTHLIRRVPSYTLNGSLLETRAHLRFLALVLVGTGVALGLVFIGDRVGQLPWYIKAIGGLDAAAVIISLVCLLAQLTLIGLQGVVRQWHRLQEAWNEQPPQT